MSFIVLFPDIRQQLQSVDPKIINTPSSVLYNNDVKTQIKLPTTEQLAKAAELKDKLYNPPHPPRDQ